MSKRTSLIALVREEASLISQHATEEEKGRLIFKDLSPGSMYRCVYGQMTGNCFSRRAVELLNLCAKPYTLSPENLIEPKNPEEGFIFEPNCAMRCFSALEYFISRHENKRYNNAHLIDFIQGRIRKFNPKAFININNEDTQ